MCYFHYIKLKPFNCLLLILSLSLSLALSIHWFTQPYCEATTTMLRLLLLYQFWLGEICIYHKPSPTRDETRDLQIALQKRSCFHFFYISSTPHAKDARACFELLGRPFRSSLLASFFLPSFLLELLWKEFNPHSFVVTFDFSFVRFTTNSLQVLPFNFPTLPNDLMNT